MSVFERYEELSASFGRIYNEIERRKSENNFPVCPQDGGLASKMYPIYLNGVPMLEFQHSDCSNPQQDGPVPNATTFVLAQGKAALTFFKEDD